jgi:hypothetical protein
MNDFKDNLVRWIDKSLQSMKRAPRMWGSWEAVEFQSLLLWEMRARVLSPNFAAHNPGFVLKTYQKFLDSTYPSHPNRYFHQQLSPDAPDDSDRALVKHLNHYQDFINLKLPIEDPFQNQDLTLHLSYKDPKATVNARDITSYYEEFVRATRAVARALPLPPGDGDGDGNGRAGSGRHRKELEEATRFTLEDVQIERPNGVPGGAWLMLGRQTEGEDPHAARQVRDALASVVQLAEWASSDDPVPPASYVGQPHVALQTLRLLPPKHLAQVELGGRLLARANPVALRASFEPKLVQVVEAHARPTPFDHTDEIRAVDLDAGVTFLGEGKKQRRRCYLTPELLRKVHKVGVQARVEGTLYERKGAAFVRASSLTLL